jgi:6-phosphofructokinase
VRAVELVAQGKFGRVVGIEADELVEIPYTKIADQRRLVDLKGDAVKAAEMSGIWLGRESGYRSPL